MHYVIFLIIPFIEYKYSYCIVNLFALMWISWISIIPFIDHKCNVVYKVKIYTEHIQNVMHWSKNWSSWVQLYMLWQSVTVSLLCCYNTAQACNGLCQMYTFVFYKNLSSAHSVKYFIYIYIVSCTAILHIICAERGHLQRLVPRASQGHNLLPMGAWNSLRVQAVLWLNLKIVWLICCKLRSVIYWCANMEAA